MSLIAFSIIPFYYIGNSFSNVIRIMIISICFILIGFIMLIILSCKLSNTTIIVFSDRMVKITSNGKSTIYYFDELETYLRIHGRRSYISLKFDNGEINISSLYMGYTKLIEFINMNHKDRNQDRYCNICNKNYVFIRDDNKDKPVKIVCPGCKDQIFMYSDRMIDERNHGQRKKGNKYIHKGYKVVYK